MPLVNIQLLEGRPQEKIETLIKEVTQTISDSLDAPAENVRVVVTEVPKTHWGIGGKTAAELGR